MTIEQLSEGEKSSLQRVIEEGGVVSIGRKPHDVDIQIEDERVSRLHAWLKLEGGSRSESFRNSLRLSMWKIMTRTTFPASSEYAQGDTKSGLIYFP